MLLAAARQRREEEQRSCARASRVAREQTPGVLTEDHIRECGKMRGATSPMTSPAASKPMQAEAAHSQGVSTIANKPNVHRSPPTSPGGVMQAAAHVTICSARHLPNVDGMWGTCDAFIEFVYKDKTYTSTVKKNSLNPDWNPEEKFEFDLSGELEDIRIQLKDSNLMTSAKLLGTTVIGVNALRRRMAGYKAAFPSATEEFLITAPDGKPLMGKDQQQAHLVLKVAVVKGPAAESTLNVDLLHLEALGVPIAKDSSPFSLSERCRSDSAAHCGSTPAKIPAPSAPSSLSVRSSSDFAAYGSSTPASLSAPSGPSWLSERKKSDSDGHCGAIAGNSWLPNPGLTKRQQFFLDESEDDDSEDSMSRESSLSCSGPGFLGHPSQAPATREGSLTTIHSQTDSTSISRQGIISLTMQRVIRLERKRVGKV